MVSILSIHAANDTSEKKENAADHGHKDETPGTIKDLKAKNVEYSYPLPGIASDDDNNYYIVETHVDVHSGKAISMDVVYSMNAKKEPAALNAPQATAKLLPATDSTITVADFLKVVNRYFPDVLPEDVLKHFGYYSRPDGELGQYALYSKRLRVGQDAVHAAEMAVQKTNYEADLKAQEREYESRIEWACLRNEEPGEGCQG